MCVSVRVGGVSGRRCVRVGVCGSSVDRHVDARTANLKDGDTPVHTSGSAETQKHIHPRAHNTAEHEHSCTFTHSLSSIPSLRLFPPHAPPPRLKIPRHPRPTCACALSLRRTASPSPQGGSTGISSTYIPRIEHSTHTRTFLLLNTLVP